MNNALFLDRDGVVNVDKGYVYKKEDFEFNPHIFHLCRQAMDADFLIVILSNQSGVARGYFSEDQVKALHDWMSEKFIQERVRLAGVYYCPHHPTIGNEDYLRDCSCRKPRPGMLLKARKDLQIDLPASIMIGDKPSDMEAAKAANIGRRILIKSRYFNTQTYEFSDRVEIVSHLSQIGIA